jgi:hypothetical protein
MRDGETQPEYVRLRERFGLWKDIPQGLKPRRSIGVVDKAKALV